MSPTTLDSKSLEALSQETHVIASLSMSSESTLSDVREEIRHHLSFIKSLIVNRQLSTSKQPVFEQELHSIEQRLNDQTFYLAVIGEFSSGKTTFINALLRDELLKTSALVTTAMITQIESGDQLDVEVQYQSKSHSKLECADLRQCIHLVTADETVTREISQVTIKHPASFLTDAIAIIDTPGANSESISHAELTQQVIQEQADAAIITIPATVPYSKSLNAFLAGSIQDYLHRCIFVVTRMDQIPVKQQAHLLNDLRSRLSQGLEITDPILCPCAAQIVIDAVNGEEILASQQQWIQQFEYLEAEILGRLKQQKSLIITEKLIRLLSELFDQLEAELKVQQTDYHHRQLTLQKEAIPNLSTFTLQQKADYRQKVQSVSAQVLQQINPLIEKHRNQLSEQIRSCIFNAQDSAALDSVVQQIQQHLENNQKQLTQEFAPLVKKLTQAGKDFDRQITQEFSQVYSRLNAPTATVQIKSSEAQIHSIPVQTLNALVTVNQEYSAKSDRTKLNGTAIGAFIGTAFLPGVGTAIGGVIGRAISTQFVPSLQEQQQTLWTTVQSTLQNYFSTAEEQANQAAKTHATQVIQALHERLNTDVTQYKHVIQSMIAAQQTEQQQIEQFRDRTTQLLNEIEQRCQKLSQRQQQLATYSSLQF